MEGVDQDTNYSNTGYGEVILLRSKKCNMSVIYLHGTDEQIHNMISTYVEDVSFIKSGSKDKIIMGVIS
jgi:hypothetical protein